MNIFKRWDPKTQQWSYSTPMISPREGCGIGVLDNEIFVIGGWNSFNNINNEGETTVEAFCPSKDKWRTCGSLNEKRHWVSVSRLCHYNTSTILITILK